MAQGDLFEQAKQLAKQGKYEAALGFFHDAGGTEGCYGEGACLFKLGRFEEAREALVHCLELDPQHEKALRLVDKIDSAAASPEFAEGERQKRRGVPRWLIVLLFGVLVVVCILVVLGVLFVKA